MLRCRYPLVELPLMKSDNAVRALAALAQENRLKLFRLLVQAGDKGLAAGAIADVLAFPTVRCLSTSRSSATQALSCRSGSTGPSSIVPTIRR